MDDSTVALAEMMVNGRGGPRDLAGALTLLEKAAEAGHSGAMFALGALYGDATTCLSTATSRAIRRFMMLAILK